MTTPSYNEDAGPKSIYEAVTARLRGDGVLRGLMDYTRQNMNIRRGFQPTGQWDRLMIFYMQPEIAFTDFSPNLRQAVMVVNLYNRRNELELYDIGERVIELLHGADLSIDGKVHCYGIWYSRENVSITYDEALKANWKSLRFELMIRKEEK